MSQMCKLRSLTDACMVTNRQKRLRGDLLHCRDSATMDSELPADAAASSNSMHGLQVKCYLQDQRSCDDNNAAVILLPGERLLPHEPVVRWQNW